MSCKPFQLLGWAALVGFIGDGVLQCLVSQGVGNWGLKAYFAQHGKAESLCIASGMMTLFYLLYLKLGLPVNLGALALYGILLDLLFRKLQVFASLDGYYEALNYGESALWGAIPLMLPLVLYQISQKFGVHGR